MTDRSLFSANSPSVDQIVADGERLYAAGWCRSNYGWLSPDSWDPVRRNHDDRHPMSRVAAIRELEAAWQE